MAGLVPAAGPDRELSPVSWTFYFYRAAAPLASLLDLAMTIAYAAKDFNTNLRN